MTQTPIQNVSTSLFARFKAWFLAMPEALAPSTEIAAEPDAENKPAAERDDSFYLALARYGHW